MKFDHGSLVIRDLAGDAYRIPDPNALDKISAKLLYLSGLGRLA